MNHTWENFLFAENTAVDHSDRSNCSPEDQNYNRICPISNLGVLSVAGKDAEKFLQGQMTCNIKDVSEIQSSLGAFCNEKGRVITTFLIVKQQSAYLLVMPLSLLQEVKNRLQRYVLRSAVTLHVSSDAICLIGLCYRNNHSTQPKTDPLFSTSQQDGGVISIAFSPNRYLILAETDPAIRLWTKLIHEDECKPVANADWQYEDISSGIPWLTPETTEEYIPQMLNLDKLGGISFTKGCYTGQEIVARTHYLGKAKRAMLVAESSLNEAPEPNTAIIDEYSNTEQVVGKVLLAANHQNNCKMLIVLQISDVNTDKLKLQNHDRNKITVLTL